MECFVSSDDSEEYIRSIGDEVERTVSLLRKQNDRVSVVEAAVFAALRFCDDARKAQASADNLRGQIKSYVEDASRARMEADEARREIDRLGRELQTLRARLASDRQDEQAAPQAAEPQRMTRQERAAARQAAQEALSALPTVTQPDPDAEKGFISFFEKKTGEE